MAHMQRARGIGADKFEQDPLTVAEAGASILGSMRFDLRQDAKPEISLHGEIDEPWRRHVGTLEHIAVSRE